MATAPSGTATKEQLPTLAGKKIKTRKRDEKVKYDPTAFADQVIAGLNETDGSMEEIAKYLDATGGQIDYRYQAEERECLVTLAHWNAGHVLVITQTSGNAPGWTINHLHLSISSHYCNVIGAASIGAGDGYQDIPSLLLPFKLGLWNVVRNIALQQVLWTLPSGRDPCYKCNRRYAEPLLDILIAGGQLAPGGKIESPVRVSVCVFTCEPMVESLKEHVQIMTKLVRQRYKYLQKSLQEEMTKILKFLKGFGEEQRRCLAIFTALCLAESLVSASILISLLTGETIVKEGLSLEFATILFQTWFKEKGKSHVGGALRKAGIENRLLELLPPTRQTPVHFDEHFKDKLKPLVEFRKTQEIASYKQKLREELDEMIGQEASNEDMIDKCLQHVMTSNNALGNVDITILLWQCIMRSVEWNKKEELVAEQAMKHLKAYCPLFLPFCEQGTPQLTLLLKMQEYCYDNMNFMKSFHKIVLLFYKNDVITEQAILKWYNDSHLQKGKSVFLKEMKRMVEWLQTAEEEESDSETAPQDSIS